MANFAQLDENNVVIQVVQIYDQDCCDSNGTETESIGIARCQELFGSDTTWIQTSFSGRKRYRLAGIGHKYDATHDAFLLPQPYPSWVVDNTTKEWVSPLGAEPTLTEDEIAARKDYVWDEDAYQADNTTGWTLTDRQ